MRPKMAQNSMANQNIGKTAESSQAAPAPLIFITILLVGIGLSRVLPTIFLPRAVMLSVGAVGFLLPFVLGFAALRAMRQAGTSVNPNQPTTTLLTEGPFRLSRNPMYLGMVIQYLGLAFLFDSLWSIVLLPLALVIIHLTVITREERYLAQRFGEEYRSYKASVRRWI